MVMGRGYARIETHYHSNDRAQNDKEQLDHLRSRGTSPLMVFRRERSCQHRTHTQKS